MADETLRIVFEGDTKDLENATQAASAEVSSFGKAASGVGSFVSSNLQSAGLAATAVVGSLALATKSAIDQAAAYQQDRISFETMLGSADKARTLLKQLSDFAASTPFQLPDVVEGGKKLLAFGVAAEDVTKTFTTLGNIAAGVGTDKLPGLINVFGQVKAAGKLMSQDLLQFTSAGVPVLDLLAQHFNSLGGAVVGTGKKVKDQGPVIAELNDKLAIAKQRLSEAEKVTGPAASSMMSLTNQLNNAKASLASLDPATKNYTDKSAKLNQQIAVLTQRMSEATSAGGAKTSTIMSLQNSIQNYEQQLATATGKQTNATAAMKKTTITAADMRQMIQDGKVSFDDLSSSLELLGGKGGKWGDLMAKQSQTFSGVVSNISDQMGRVIRSVVGINEQGDIRKGSLFAIAIDLANQLMTKINEVSPMIVSLSQKILGNKDAVLGILGAIAGLAAGIAAAFIAAFGPVILLVGAFALVGTGIALLVAHWQDVTHWVNEHGKAILAVLAILFPLPLAIAGIVVQVAKHWQAILAAFKNAWTEIGDGLDWLKNHWLEAIGYVLGFLATLPIKMGIWMGEGIAAMGVALMNNFPKMLDAWGKLLDDYKRFWMDCWNGMINFVKNINWGDVLKGMQKGLGDGLSGFLKGAVGGIPGGGDLLKALNISSHASGGIVPGSVGSPMLAMVHGGERIIPNGGGASGQTINIDLSGTSFGNRSDIDYLVDQVRKVMGRQGELAQLGAI